MDVQNNQTTITLQNHIAHLTSLVERVNTLRKIPGFLWAPSTLIGSQLEQGFDQIHDFKSAVDGSTTQDCLRHARESFSQNEQGTTIEGRRQSRKRRRPPSLTPESPRPLPVLPEQIFPPAQHTSPASLSELPAYIREQNQVTSATKLHIWTPTRPRSRVEFDQNLRQSTETVLRITIKDVLYAYLRLCSVPVKDGSQVNVEASRNAQGGFRIVTESVIVFGSRERKSPHSQSDFTVFQKLTQHITWMLQAEPDVELSSIINLFKSYETLFISQCTLCHRVLSEEGHFPPVCRVWTPTRRIKDTNVLERENVVLSVDDDGGSWEPRHKTCFNGSTR